MNARRKIILGSTLGAIAIHLAFLACGTPTPARDAGGAADANGPLDAMSEMMGDVADRETSTADAQGMPMPMVLEARCEAVDGGAGAWAVFDVPSVSFGTVPKLTASVCGLAAGGFALPPGFQGPQSCIAGGVVWYANGRAATSCLSGSTTARLRVE